MNTPQLSAQSQPEEQAEIQASENICLQPARKPANKFLITGISILLLISLTMASFFAYQSSKLKQKTASSAQPSPNPTIINPSPTPNPTANWEIYSGRDGYSFQYPDNCKLNDYNEANYNGIFLLCPDPKAQPGINNMNLGDGVMLKTITLGHADKNLKEIAEDSRLQEIKTSEELGSSSVGLLQSTILGEKTAYFFTVEGISRAKIILAQGVRGFLRISGSYAGPNEKINKHSQLLDQILSTFKFTSLSSQTEEISQAREFLVSYFDLLSEEKYLSAASYHGSGYEYLQNFCPNYDPETQKSELFACACANALKCLKILHVLEQKSVSSSSYVFTVQFANPDGTLFKKLPCCGATEETMPTQTDFDYTVEKTGEGYKVTTQLIYIP